MSGTQGRVEWPIAQRRLGPAAPPGMARPCLKNETGDGICSPSQSWRLTALLGLSLFSYHRDDPMGEPIFPLSRLYHPDTLTFPPATTIHNLVRSHRRAGRRPAALGPRLGRVLPGRLTGRGRRRAAAARHDPRSRLAAVGWLLSLIGLTSLIAMLAPARWSGPMIGPGGYLGSLGYGLLQLHFAAVGGFLLASQRRAVRTDPLHRLRAVPDGPDRQLDRPRLVSRATAAGRSASDHVHPEARTPSWPFASAVSS